MPKARQWGSTRKRKVRAATTPSSHRRPDRPSARCASSARRMSTTPTVPTPSLSVWPPCARACLGAKIGRSVSTALFFMQAIVDRLHAWGPSSPSRCRSSALRQPQRNWSKADDGWRPMAGSSGSAYFETRWKPKSWNTSIASSSSAHRNTNRCQNKAVRIQLDLFQPIEYGYEFKVIVTNNKTNPRKVVL